MRGTTLCSQTARQDAENIFGISSLPMGDANIACAKYPLGYTNKNTGLLKVGKTMTNAPENANFIDIFTESNSAYGHRLIGFKQ